MTEREKIALGAPGRGSKGFRSQQGEDNIWGSWTRPRDKTGREQQEDSAILTKHHVQRRSFSLSVVAPSAQESTRERGEVLLVLLGILAPLRSSYRLVFLRISAKTWHLLWGVSGSYCRQPAGAGSPRGMPESLSFPLPTSRPCPRQVSDTGC